MVSLGHNVLIDDINFTIDKDGNNTISYKLTISTKFIKIVSYDTQYVYVVF